MTGHRPILNRGRPLADPDHVLDLSLAFATLITGALDYISNIGFEAIMKYERELLQYATEKLLAIPGLAIIGQAKDKASLISFVLQDIHPHDIGTILDQEGIAIRAGHHCSQPTMKRFGITATARASFAFYNTKEEIDTLVRGVEKVKKVLL